VFALPDGFQSPFDNIENAHDYLVLLSEAVEEARQNVAADLSTEANAKLPRRLEAVRLAHYKLEKLEQHIKVSRRLLNDLRTLRRLLFEERTETEVSQAPLDRRR
jgi:formiminotetrahydrofolate cyclodeaminase